MKYLNGENSVEVKERRYRIHPPENIILRLRDPPTSLKTQYRVQNETQIRKNQKAIRDGNNEIIVKNYPKSKQPIVKKTKLKPPLSPSCKQNIWLQLEKGCYCWNCEYINNRKKTSD